MEVACTPDERPRLHGRSQERATIGGLIGAARGGWGRALVLRGEAGTGKSALLEDAADRAGSLRVLRCQGDRAESDLRFAMLHQLLRPLAPLAGALPPRLATALATVFGLDAIQLEPGRAATAVLALLAAAAREQPLLCLIDDAQWLDPPSAAVLSFVARRLAGERIALLVAARSEEGRPFQPAGVTEARLVGLEPWAAASLLMERAGAALAPEVASQLVRQTAGLPLALIDATSSLTPAQLAGRASLPDPLPLTPYLRDSFLDRAWALPGPARRMLELVAAAGAERVEAIEAAARLLGIEKGALAQVEGWLALESGQARVAGHLARSAIYHGSSVSERRSAHLALAQVLRDDRCVWHRAAAALPWDGATAAELERLAERGGDAPTRASALQRAAELTPEGPECCRRLIAAARACWLAGRPAQCAELLRRASLLRPAAPLLAEIAELRGAGRLHDLDPNGAADCWAAGAARVAATEPGRAAHLLIDAASAALAAADGAGVRAIASQAEALLPHAGDCALLVRAVVSLGRGGRGAGRLANRALELARAGAARGGDLLSLAMSLSGGHELTASAHATALDLLAGEVARLREAGAAGGLPTALSRLAWAQFWADRHPEAHASALEGVSLAAGLGQRWAEAGCATTLALLAAIRGDDDTCARRTATLLRPTVGRGAAFHAASAAWATALADLSWGRAADAVARLDSLARPGHPWVVLWSRPDMVEAAVRAGRDDEARAALATLERAADEGWPAPAAALLARSRALLAPAPQAESLYREALARHAESDRPFQEARTRLLWGEQLRRERRRAEAREQLRLAFEGLQRLGAMPWADRARAELNATGEARGRGAYEPAEMLTPQELRIARLVAEGGSNREVAQRLFLSPRTVGYHLANIYQKLDVSSRTRLASLVLRDDMSPPRAHARARRG